MIDAGKKSAGSLTQLVNEMKRTGEAGKFVGKGVSDSMAGVGANGKRSIDEIIASMERLSPEGAEQANRFKKEWDAVNHSNHFDAVLASLGQLGEAGKFSANEIKRELSEADAQAKFDTTMMSLQALGPEGQAQAEKIRNTFAEVDKQTKLDAMITQLREVGDEGAIVADRLRQELGQSAKDSSASMEEILEKIREIDPTAADAGNRIHKEMAASAEESKKELDKLIGKLKEMGPVGKRMADKLAEDFDKASTDAESDIGRIITKIKAIDPAVGTSAEKMRTHFENTEKKGTSTFANIATSAGTQLAGVLTAYTGLQEAIGSVNAYLVQQEQLLQSTLNTHIELAKAQQEASKNLAGLTAVQRSELLQNAVPDIAADTGFSDLPLLTTAIGASVSRGADAEQAESVTRQSARYNVNTPENIDETAGSAVALMNQTGLADPRQAIGLIGSTIKRAAIGDPEAITDAMPKAIGSSVATVRSQNPEEAAREASALFAVITQGGNDTKGASSATFQTDLTTRLGTFFSDFDNVLMDARSKIQKLEAKKDPTLSDKRDLAQLQQFVAKGEEVKPLQNPEAFTTLFGRIGLLQKVPELRQHFQKDEFGEKQFQTVKNDIFDATSKRAQELKQSYKEIHASVEFFEDQVKQITSGTPQLSLANYVNKGNADSEAQKMTDFDGATMAAMRETVATTLEETRSGGFRGYIESWRQEYGIEKGAAAGHTAVEESVHLMNNLRSRRGSLEAGGVTQSESVKIERIDREIEAMKTLLMQEAPRLDPQSFKPAYDTAVGMSAGFRANGNTADADFFRDLAITMKGIQTSLDRQNEIAERAANAGDRTAEASVKTAANTVPKPPRPSELQRAAVAASNNRGSQQ